jgi:plastocyanin
MSPKNLLRSPIRLAVVALASIAIALVLTACGSSSGSKSSGATADTNAEPTGAATASGDTVNIKLIAYRPGKLSVSAGTSVTWHQMDPGVHTVTSGTVEQAAGGVTIHPDGKFDSGELATGRRFTQRFDTPGTYTYFCRIHPATMRGEITVK